MEMSNNAANAIAGVSIFVKQSKRFAPTTQLHCDRQYPLLTSKPFATGERGKKYSLGSGKS
jgi:hypothetical protein